MKEQWEYDLKQNYRISKKEYEAILAEQNGKCAVCGEEEKIIDKYSGRQRRLAVDHDHTTGQVRGLLCSRCNLILGHSKDDKLLLCKLVTYLMEEKRNICSHRSNKPNKYITTEDIASKLEISVYAARKMVKRDLPYFIGDDRKIQVAVEDFDKYDYRSYLEARKVKKIEQNTNLETEKQLEGNKEMRDFTGGRENKILKITIAAEILQLSRSQVYRLIQSGEITCVPVSSGSVRILGSEINKYLAKKMEFMMERHFPAT